MDLICPRLMIITLYLPLRILYHKQVLNTCSGGLERSGDFDMYHKECVKIPMLGQVFFFSVESKFPPCIYMSKSQHLSQRVHRVTDIRKHCLENQKIYQQTGTVNPKYHQGLYNDLNE